MKENITKTNKNKSFKIVGEIILLIAVVAVTAFVTYTITSSKNQYKEEIDLTNGNENEQLKELAYSSGECLSKCDKLAAALMFGKAGDYKDAAEKSTALWNEVAKRKIVDVGCYYVIAVSDEGKILLDDGNIIGDYESELKSWDNLVAVAAGDWVAAGLREDGTVVAAGEGTESVKDWNDIVLIEAGNSAIAGLRKDGTVVCTDKALNKKVSKWSDVVDIDMEGSYILGLCINGTVLCSDNWDMSEMTNIIEIAAGSQHCAGLRSDGTVVAVGDGISGSNFGLDVEEWSDIVSISAADFITYGVKNDGTVVSTGNATAIWEQDYGLHLAESWNDVATISSEYINVACIHKDGTVSSITHGSGAYLDHADWELYKKS